MVNSMKWVKMHDVCNPNLFFFLFFSFKIHSGVNPLFTSLKLIIERNGTERNETKTNNKNFNDLKWNDVINGR